MIKKLLLAFVAIIAVLLVVIAMQPSEYNVSRSATLQAPPSVVFEHINHLRSWEEWSPWAKLDPNVVNSYEGPEQGVGAQSAWEGNSDVGKGYMRITESVPNERIVMDLVFLEPMEGKAVVAFDLSPAGTGTDVTWTMSGENNFLGKAFGLVMNMDKMIGKDFEQGLTNLDAVTSQPASVPAN